MVPVLLFLLTIAAMELFAYTVHRWVMHGPGWFLHASHHRPRLGSFEANDLYALIFALPSIALIWLGVQGGWGNMATAMGAGIAAYGMIYFVFHDALVHQRVPNRYVPRSSWMKRITQAHRLHHAVDSRKGAVSFGFIYAPPVPVLKRQLQDQADARLRASRG